MSPEEIQRALAELAARVARLEQASGVANTDEPSTVEPERIEPVEAPVHALPPAQRPPQKSSVSAATSTPSSVAAPPDDASVPRFEADSHDRQSVPPQASVIRTDDAPPPKVATPRRQLFGSPLELQIGMRLAAWVGAIVVVVAMGFFVKLAYDQGWWGRLSPLTKCLLSAGFGGALIAAGEVALRKAGRIAAVSLFAAGLGTLYLTAYSTFRFFELLSQGGAFWLMLLVAVFGLGITIRGRVLAIGVLSLLGGYATPVLLAGAATFPAALPLYMSTLLIVTLALSAWRPEPYRPLRYVGIVFHAIVATLWLMSEGSENWIIAVAFMTGWWGLLTAELLLAAFRGQSAIGNPLASLFATIWYVSAGCGTLAGAAPDHRDWLGIFTLATACACAAIALPFGPGLGVLKTLPRRAMEKLTVTLWGQVGILLAGAIALQFREPGESFGQTIGWLTMAVACVEVGRRLPSRGVEVFALIIGTLALVRVWGVDPWLSSLRRQVWAYGDVTVNRWGVLALSAVAATHFAARRVRMHGFSRADRLSVTLAVLGTLQWMALCVAQSNALATTSGWILGAVVLLAAVPIGRRQRYMAIAVFALAVTTTKWLALDVTLPRLDPSWDATAAAPVSNWPTALGIVLIACLGWGYWLLRPKAPDGEKAPSPAQRGSNHPELLLVWGSLLLLVALSFDIDRAVERMLIAETPLWWSGSHLKSLMLTVLWTLGALGMGGLVAVLPRLGACSAMPGPLAWSAWAVLIVCAAKWVAFDTLSVRMGEETALVIHPWPVLNLQMAAGAVLAGAGLGLTALSGRRLLTPAQLQVRAHVLWVDFLNHVPVVAALLLLWGLTFEVDRAIGQFEAARVAEQLNWHGAHLRELWFILLWAAVGVAMIIFGRDRPQMPFFPTGWFLLIVAAGAWLTLGTLRWRVPEGVVVAPILLNPQFSVGLATATFLLLATRKSHADATWSKERKRTAAAVVQIGYWLAGLTGIWLGSFEIDRFFAPAANRVALPEMARHTTLSVYWGVYALVLLAIGFRRRSAWSRYAGLALLGITLGKVALVDLSELRYLYRVLSLLAIGLLFMATSVAYAKLSSRLLPRPTVPID